MWNPFKTLGERDSARLRRLESNVADLADDIEICLSTIPKINARLRQRARRAADESEDVAEDAAEAPAPFLVPAVSGDRTDGSRATLLALARARGLR